MTRSTKTLLAHIALVRFLVRVNTHVVFKSLDYEKLYHKHRIHTVSRSREYACALSNHQITKSFIANIAFVRFLVRVNTHVLSFKLHSRFVRKTRFSHTSHSYGFSFVCVRLCLVKSDGYRNTFSQTSHSCPPLFLFTPFLIKAVSSSRI